MKAKCNFVLLKRAAFHSVESSQDKIDEHYGHIIVGERNQSDMRVSTNYVFIDGLWFHIYMEYTKLFDKVGTPYPCFRF